MSPQIALSHPRSEVTHVKRFVGTVAVDGLAVRSKLYINPTMSPKDRYVIVKKWKCSKKEEKGRKLFGYMGDTCTCRSRTAKFDSILHGTPGCQTKLASPLNSDMLVVCVACKLKPVTLHANRSTLHTLLYPQRVRNTGGEQQGQPKKHAEKQRFSVLIDKNIFIATSFSLTINVFMAERAFISALCHCATEVHWLRGRRQLELASRKLIQRINPKICGKTLINYTSVPVLEFCFVSPF